MVKQGDIIKLNLDPKEGHEQQGYRPYICLSYKGVIQYSKIAVFAPISNTNRNYPMYVPLKETKTTGKVLLDQLVTIDFNARKYLYIESVDEKFIDKLLKIAQVNFEKD